MPLETRLSVVIPVYGSAACLEANVLELCEALASVSDYEVILVNDDSPDDAESVISALCRGDTRIKQVTLARNVGQHRAILRGLAETSGETVVTIDDDGQNPPSAVVAVAGALYESDLDVVYGRFDQTDRSSLRRLASRLNRAVSRLTLSNRRKIEISNVRALRGDLARWLGASRTSYPYVDALVFRATNRIGEVDVEHRPRKCGRSTYSLWSLAKLWLSHLTSLTLFPLQVAVAGSFGVSILALLLGAFQMIHALTERRAPAGWLSLFTAISFFFSVLFLFLGIISIYVGRLYVSINDKDLVWERGSSLDQESATPGSGAAGV
jgi:undecaprenyl-phosphate 4-deoxy-4-formamido-L-arabinose transferase